MELDSFEDELEELGDVEDFLGGRWFIRSSSGRDGGSRGKVLYHICDA